MTSPFGQRVQGLAHP